MWTRKIIGNSKENSNHAVFFYPFWKGSSKVYWPYQNRNVTNVLYDYPPSILSPNIIQTDKAIRELVDDSIKLSRKFKSISVFGSSLGSTPAFMVAAKSDNCTSAVLNTIGKDFAFNVWNGTGTSHIKKALENKMTLDDLRRIWISLTPEHYNIKNKKMLIFMAEKDTVIPYENQVAFVNMFKENNDLTINIENLSHAHAIVKNLLKFSLIKPFLQAKA